MDEQEWRKRLEAEGFRDISVCANPPGAEFPEHTHEEQTVHVILSGEFTLIEKGGARTVRSGERFDIPAGTTHSAKCGPAGCTFLVGTKAP